MVSLKVESVAPSASKVEDIIIRENKNSRLLLRPILVDNDSNEEACVKGSIIYQKKNDLGEYREDKNVFDLRKVKKGECARFELKSEEVLVILQKYDMLKELYKKEGLNFGETTYCITEGDLEEVWNQLSKFKNRDKLIEALKKLSDEDIDNLSFMVSVGKIDKMLEIWQLNKENSNENFWQNEFSQNGWILSQIFACPYVCINDKPYVGGKSIQNIGGVLSDLLMKQCDSKNIAFIEIKTPASKLMSNSLYRGVKDEDVNAVYSNHFELSGSINQVLNQRNVFLREHSSKRDESRDYENPKCVVIIGNKGNLTDGQLRNFDLFRHNLPNIEVVTFDELFSKIQMLKDIFQMDN
jgi:hypothetical protein